MPDVTPYTLLRRKQGEIDHLLALVDEQAKKIETLKLTLRAARMVLPKPITPIEKTVAEQIDAALAGSPAEKEQQ